MPTPNTCPACHQELPPIPLPQARAREPIRYRVNSSITARGQITWDCTVEGTGRNMSTVLRLHDRLIASLRERYPNPDAPPLPSDSISSSSSSSPHRNALCYCADHEPIPHLSHPQ